MRLRIALAACYASFRRSGRSYAVIALLIPSQLAAPIASGSVSWIPHNDLVPSGHALTGITVAGPRCEWDWYQMPPETPTIVVLRWALYALAMAAQVSTPNREGDCAAKEVAAWRGVPSPRHLPVNSRVDNITIP